MGHLSDEQFEKLERALCSAEGLGTLNRSKKDAKHKTCAAGSSKKTESVSTEGDSSTSVSPERVFEPRPPQSSREGRQTLITSYGFCSYCREC